MIPFQERKKLRKILYSKFTLFVLFVLLIVVGRGAWKIHEKAVVAQTERDIAIRSLDDLGSRTNALQASLVLLKSDHGIESEVRQKYTVALTGEEVVVVVDDNTKKSENGEVVEKSFWQHITSFFGF